jgi:hypothetical protein
MISEVPGTRIRNAKIFFASLYKAMCPGRGIAPGTRERRQLLYLSLMVLRVHLYAGDLFKVMQ